MKKDQHPRFDNERDARRWADSQDAQKLARLDAIAQREKWKSQYYDFDDLVKRYSKAMEEKQPRSYETFLHYFKTYAIDYFIGEKHASNPNNWFLLFPDFRDWLKQKNSRNRKGLAIATRNHIIVSVNNFLTFLAERGELNLNSHKKCMLFKTDDKNLKDDSCVITPEEFAIIKPKLEDRGQDAIEAAAVLKETGLRLNEFRGLTMDSLYSGKIENKALATELHRAGKDDYYGYILLMSQPRIKKIEREKSGKMKRGPLKGSGTISLTNARIIPIFNEEVWHILVARYEKAENLLKKKVYGEAEENYLLFDEFAGSTFGVHLKAAYEGTGFKPKSAHDFRHTYATYLVGETGSSVLTRLILGHKKESTFERYNHIHQQILRKAQREQNKPQRVKPLKEKIS